MTSLSTNNVDLFFECVDQWSNGIHEARCDIIESTSIILPLCQNESPRTREAIRSFLRTKEVTRSETSGSENSPNGYAIIEDDDTLPHGNSVTVESRGISNQLFTSGHVISSNHRRGDYSDSSLVVSIEQSCLGKWEGFRCHPVTIPGAEIVTNIAFVKILDKFSCASEQECPTVGSEVLVACQWEDPPSLPMSTGYTSPIVVYIPCRVDKIEYGTVISTAKGSSSALGVDSSTCGGGGGLHAAISGGRSSWRAGVHFTFVTSSKFVDESVGTSSEAAASSSSFVRFRVCAASCLVVATPLPSSPPPSTSSIALQPQRTGSLEVLSSSFLPLSVMACFHMLAVGPSMEAVGVGDDAELLAAKYFVSVLRDLAMSVNAAVASAGSDMAITNSLHRQPTGAVGKGRGGGERMSAVERIVASVQHSLLHYQSVATAVTSELHSRNNIDLEREAAASDRMTQSGSLPATQTGGAGYYASGVAGDGAALLRRCREAVRVIEDCLIVVSSLLEIVVRGVESSAKLAASSEVGEEGRGSTDEEAPLDTIHAALVSLMLMLANQDSGLPALVKLVYVLPVPYAVPVRDWCASMSAVLNARSALLYVLALGRCYNKTHTKLRKVRLASSSTSTARTASTAHISSANSSTSASTSPPPAILKLSLSQLVKCAEDFEDALEDVTGAALESFQSTVEAYFMDDVGRQEWASNNQFRKGQRPSYGITATGTAYRSFIHDLLSSSCHHPYFVTHFSVRLIAIALRAIVAMYSALTVSRTRLGQWSSDMKMALHTACLTVRFLVAAGLLRCDGSAQPEFINRQADWHWGMSQQAAGLRRSSDCSSGAGGGIAGSEGVDAVVTPRSVLPLAVDSWSETLADEEVQSLVTALLEATTTLYLVAENDGKAVAAAVEAGLSMGLLQKPHLVKQRTKLGSSGRDDAEAAVAGDDDIGADADAGVGESEDIAGIVIRVSVEQQHHISPSQQGRESTVADGGTVRSDATVTGGAGTGTGGAGTGGGGCEGVRTPSKAYSPSLDAVKSFSPVVTPQQAFESTPDPCARAADAMISNYSEDEKDEARTGRSDPIPLTQTAAPVAVSSPPSHTQPHSPIQAHPSVLTLDVVCSLLRPDSLRPSAGDGGAGGISAASASQYVTLGSLTASAATSAPLVSSPQPASLAPLASSPQPASRHGSTEANLTCELTPQASGRSEPSPLELPQAGPLESAAPSVFTHISNAGYFDWLADLSLLGTTADSTTVAADSTLGEHHHHHYRNAHKSLCRCFDSSAAAGAMGSAESLLVLTDATIKPKENQRAALKGGLFEAMAGWRVEASCVTQYARLTRRRLNLLLSNRYEMLESSYPALTQEQEEARVLLTAVLEII